MRPIMDAYVVASPTADRFLGAGGFSWTTDPQQAMLYVNRWAAEVDAAGVHGQVLSQRLALQVA